jgi:hypothetical protein
MRIFDSETETETDCETEAETNTDCETEAETEADGMRHVGVSPALCLCA